MSINFLLICRDGENEELRYAIRSWDKMISGKKTLTIVGGKPEWCNPDLFIKGNEVPFDRNIDKYSNVFGNYITALSKDSVPEKLILMNDDFFCMRKTNQTDMKNYRNHLTLIQHAEKCVKKYSRETRFSKKLLATDKHLSIQGVKERYSYALHRPLIFEKSKMITIVNSLKDSDAAIRSVYGNTYLKCEEGTHDSKHMRNTPNVDGNDWISTSDDSFKDLAVVFKSLYPEKSRWEE